MSKDDASGGKGLMMAGVAVFAAALLFLAFSAGVVTSVFKAWPFPQMQRMVQMSFDLMQGGGHDDSVHFLHKERYSGSGVLVNQSDRVQPGMTFISGMWPDGENWTARLRLIDQAGGLLHEWYVDPQRIWPDSLHPFDPSSGTEHPFNYVHGAWLLPGGDVVFNIEYLGLARMNACGEVVWSLPVRTHHSVSLADDGNFWVSGMHLRDKPVAAYPQVQPPFVEDVLLKVSADGEVLREISTLEALYSSGYQGVLSTSARSLVWDFNHLNDVEELSEELAGDFPMFVPGDLLISLRNFNLVLVLDGVDGKVKWHFRHPLIRQHDPDFEPGGRIVILDNNDDTTADGSLWGGSRLVSVDPLTGDYELLYSNSREADFYTQTAGKHQLLDNGNRLITEANAGRIIELSPEGEIVWEWLTDVRYEGMVPEILEGSRYPVDILEGSSCTN